MSDDSKPIKGDSEWKAGDTPPGGSYTCMNCTDGESVFLVPAMGQRLPKCPICGGNSWYKI